MSVCGGVFIVCVYVFVCVYVWVCLCVSVVVLSVFSCVCQMHLFTCFPFVYDFVCGSVFVVSVCVNGSFFERVCLSFECFPFCRVCVNL